MTFLWRELLWLLTLVPMLVGAYLVLLRRRRLVIRLPNVALVREATAGSYALRRHIPPLLFLLALIALLVAAARPAKVVTLLSAQRTIVLTIDVSLSMAATDVSPTRLGAAQAAAKAFVRQQPSDVRVGIVSFAGTADLVQAPTANRARLMEAIDGLTLDYHTAIGSGMIAALMTIFPNEGIERGYDIFGMRDLASGVRAVSLYQPPGTKPRLHTPVAAGSYLSAAIILLTDGSRTMGPDPLTAARVAAERGVRIYTVGFGTAEGARVGVDGWVMDVGFDEETLKSIADITRGEYFRADSAEALQRVYRDLGSRFVVERREIELGALFAAAAALLTIAAAALTLMWFHRAS